ncbi:fumarylacetoacetate hydrolase family protein [Ideonella dechloratans]|uniref:fumarylacetoacetate hydrolase family protein n=1 Tax=Ideonella dechloratans TaxID=36863 RepID=UPI0035B0FEE0
MNLTPIAAEVVAALCAAHRTRQPADNRRLAQALSSLDEGYAVQHAVGRQLGWWGEAPAQTWKSGGGTLDTITHAPLPPAGVRQSPADLGDLPLHSLGIEAEVALRLGVAVDAARAAALDEAAAAALVDAMAVSVEVVDSRWRDGPQAAPLLRLADGQSHGALVLGTWRPVEPARDWAAQHCRVQIGAAAPFECRGSHPLGRPTAVLPAWLRHVTREGAVLPAGSVVTTGSWVGLLHAQAGDAVTVAFDGLGEVALRF